MLKFFFYCRCFLSILMVMEELKGFGKKCCKLIVCYFYVKFCDCLILFLNLSDIIIMCGVKFGFLKLCLKSFFVC